MYCRLTGGLAVSHKSDKDNASHNNATGVIKDDASPGYQRYAGFATSSGARPVSLTTAAFPSEAPTHKYLGDADSLAQELTRPRITLLNAAQLRRTIRECAVSVALTSLVLLSNVQFGSVCH
eukprot:scaffold44718_cov22-Tisochrysis_lutea.AAC.1